MSSENTDWWTNSLKDKKTKHNSQRKFKAIGRNYFQWMSHHFCCTVFTTPILKFEIIWLTWYLMKVQQLHDNGWKKGVLSVSTLWVCFGHIEATCVVLWPSDDSYFGRAIQQGKSNSPERSNTSHTNLSPRSVRTIWGVWHFDFENPFINGVTSNALKSWWRTPPRLPRMQAVTGVTGLDWHDEALSRTLRMATYFIPFILLQNFP